MHRRGMVSHSSRTTVSRFFPRSSVDGQPSTLLNICKHGNINGTSLPSFIGEAGQQVVHRAYEIKRLPSRSCQPSLTLRAQRLRTPGLLSLTNRHEEFLGSKLCSRYTSRCCWQVPSCSLRVYEQANTVGHKGKMSLNVVVNPAFSLNCFVSSMLELVKRTRSNGDRISGRIQGHGKKYFAEGYCQSTIARSAKRVGTGWRQPDEVPHPDM